ncbi:MAG: nucleotidyltransferase family protein [Candidatus Aenigmarchaeota archaeon]|nr:nucleotidyltransferase family protein [Candidatus Aenigmarchaeota archaeon]
MEKLTRKTITEKIKKNRKELSKYGVKKIGLFGSFARQTQRKRSDIDILIKLDKPTFDNYIELKFMLEKMFHRKVDLVIEDNLKSGVEHIKEETIYV